ncbi:hypothetical protein NQ315_008245 [Exocentrus adspersus]|uniref:Endonuclease/exonuclease/phosphatase domain-containing protein n=1 Tax=Exocentrus adspersus TaxID=1586481 RepID=A0AAV8VM82_9CUCU|nr:hypothetical protein NQ315_008245 [Exocentrus adspersus]
MDAAKLAEKLVGSISSKEIGGPPKAVRKIRDGQLLIVAKDEGQKTKIEANIRKLGNVEVREMRKEEPLLMISGVEKGQEETELVGKILRQNADVTDKTDADGLKIVRRVNCRNPWKENLIVKTNLETFKAIAKKGRIEMDYKYSTTQRSTWGCRKRKTCFKCGREHDSWKCKESERKCVNCWRMFGKVESHSARDSVCPAMIQALEKSRRNFNMGRGREASELFFRKVRLENFDIIAVQEPGSDCTLLGYQTFRAGTERDKVITLVRNGLGRVWMRRDKLSQNFLVIEFELRGQNLVIGNLYDEPPEAGKPCRFSEVEEWVRQRQQFARMIVAWDFNAKHTVWGSPWVDERGDLVHEWSGVNGWIRLVFVGIGGSGLRFSNYFVYEFDVPSLSRYQL